MAASITPIWPTDGAPTTGNPPSQNLIAEVNYYVGRLISQYATKPKAQKLIALLSRGALVEDLATQILSAFVLDQAVGVQLDILGKYIGASRIYGTATAQGLFSLWLPGATLNPSKYQGVWNPLTDTPTIPAASGGNTGNWYVVSVAGTSTAPISQTWVCGDVIYSDGSSWLRDSTDSGNGLTDASNPAINANGIFYSAAYAASAVNSLPDPSYRTLLKLKSIENTNDGTLYTINLLLAALFPGLISLTDNQDMTLTYVCDWTIPLPLAVLQSYLPKPMGVGISVSISTPTPPTGDTRVTSLGDTRVLSDGSIRVLS